MLMPSPGAVWPASVQSARLTSSMLLMCISPFTANTMVSGSSGYCWKAQRSVPSLPSSASDVTVTTCPPRPPVVYLPKPSAVGNAGAVSRMATALDVTPWRDTARTVYDELSPCSMVYSGSVTKSANTPSL